MCSDVTLLLRRLATSPSGLASYLSWSLPLGLLVGHRAKHSPEAMATNEPTILAPSCHGTTHASCENLTTPSRSTSSFLRMFWGYGIGSTIRCLGSSRI